MNCNAKVNIPNFSTSDELSYSVLFQNPQLACIEFLAIKQYNAIIYNGTQLVQFSTNANYLLTLKLL